MAGLEVKGGSLIDQQHDFSFTERPDALKHTDDPTNAARGMLCDNYATPCQQGVHNSHKSPAESQSQSHGASVQRPRSQAELAS